MLGQTIALVVGSFFLGLSMYSGSNVYHLPTMTTQSVLVASYGHVPRMLRFDAHTRALTVENVAGAGPELQQCSWLAQRSTDGPVYALTIRDSNNNSFISVLHVHAGQECGETSVETLQTLPTGGQSSCHVGFSGDGKSMLLANVRE